MENKYNKRIIGIYFIFLFLFALISIKIVYLQVFKSNFFQNLAQNQYYRIVRLEGRRGNIFDCQGRMLATEINCYSVFADPYLISQPEPIAAILASNLALPEQEVLSKLKKKKRFVWIERKISLEDKEKLEVLSLKGIGFIRETKRFYPQGDLVSSVIGIVDIDNKGLEGLELFYNDYLSGKNGWVRILQDSRSQEIILSSQIINPQKGADIVLTLDAQIQYWAEYFLSKTIKDFGAKNGEVVVMDADSGKILALVNYPSFDPNKLDAPLENMRNRVVCDMFEPGSVFKITTLIAAISEGKFSDQDKIFCEKGSFKIPGSVLHDWRPYGEITFKEVFMKSSNIGVAKIANSLGPSIFSHYVKLLGFGKITGIDLPGETKGKFKPLSKWSKTSSYIIPIGQEIGVSLLQLVRAFAVIANGGYLVKPYIVENIYSRGFSKTTVPKKKKIIPASIAERARNILIEVVEEGTGKNARVEGRKIGGKTGTAQKYDPKTGRYSSSQYRATFVGFIADINPPLVIGVTIDEPKKSHFGGVVAAPVFREIAQKVIKYYEAKTHFPSFEEQ